MPLVGFEPTTQMSDRSKTVHTLSRAATVVSVIKHNFINFTLAQIAAESEALLTNLHTS
jgi:predicted lactoylglutathione lyase